MAKLCRSVSLPLFARLLAARLWLKDDTLEESANLPPSEIIAQEITDDLEAPLEQFATIAEDLK